MVADFAANNGIGKNKSKPECGAVNFNFEF